MNPPSPEQSMAVVIKTLNAALEHVPQNTKEVLFSIVQPHAQNLEQHFKNLQKSV